MFDYVELNCYCFDIKQFLFLFIMMAYRFYDLCAFADVIRATDKQSFLVALKRHLEQALLIYEDEGDSDENRRLDFKLTLLIVTFVVNNRLLEEKQDRIRFFENNSRFFRRIRRRVFWQKYLLFLRDDPMQFPEEFPEMKISVKEMIVLATTVYVQKGWGCCDNLKRELELMA